MAEQFVGGYQHNVETRNMTATVTAVVVAGRALLLIGRYLVWHVWDKGNGDYVKIDGMDEIEMSEEQIAALQAQQPQPLKQPPSLPPWTIATTVPSHERSMPF